MLPPVTCSGAAYSGGERAELPALGGEPLVRLARIDQLGDAEVEKPGLPLTIDQNVLRLQIAMHDQVGVRIAHRVQDLQEDPETLRDPQLSCLAVLIDALPVDVLEHDVRLSERRQAGVDQSRYVRVAQPRQDARLATEPGLAVAADEAGVEQLHRGLAGEPAVAPVREPDAPHSPLAERRAQCVVAEHEPSK